MATKTKTNAQPGAATPEKGCEQESAELPTRARSHLPAQVTRPSQERKPVQALLCEGVNEVFAKRNMPWLAK